MYWRQKVQSFKEKFDWEDGFLDTRFSKFLQTCIAALARFQTFENLFHGVTFFDFLSNRRLRLLFEGVGGLRPPPPGGFAPGRRRGYWSPGRACQRCNVSQYNKIYKKKNHVRRKIKINYPCKKPSQNNVQQPYQNFFNQKAILSYVYQIWNKI